jgi:hypothetical protein
MAKAFAVSCPVCSGPVRQQIDCLLLLGWRPDKIVQKLGSAALTAKDIMAHHRRLHVRAHKPALIAVAIGVMQDLREELRRVDTELKADVPGWESRRLTDPAKAIAEGKNPYAVEMAARSLAPYRKFRLLKYAEELQTKKLKVIETLLQHVCKNRNARPQLINNESLQNVSYDPLTVESIKAFLERNGYEVTRRSKAPSSEHQMA